MRASLIRSGLHPQTTYPDRIVHSVYLDDHDFSHYYDNVSGISRRSKTRLRWYDDDTSILVLEIKRKVDKLSDKQIIKIANPNGEVPRTRTQYRKLLDSAGASLFRAHYSRLFPVLEVEYQRSYFQLTPAIRMTLDVGIRYRKLYPHLGRTWRKSQVDAVVEFKYPPSEREHFMDRTKDLPFRVFRHSKYVVGVDNVCVG